MCSKVVDDVFDILEGSREWVLWRFAVVSVKD